MVFSFAKTFSYFRSLNDFYSFHSRIFWCRHEATLCWGCLRTNSWYCGFIITRYCNNSERWCLLFFKINLSFSFFVICRKIHIVFSRYDQFLFVILMKHWWRCALLLLKKIFSPTKTGINNSVLFSINGHFIAEFHHFMYLLLITGIIVFYALWINILSFVFCSFCSFLLQTYCFFRILAFWSQLAFITNW